jgi:TPR repeat protein
MIRVTLLVGILCLLQQPVLSQPLAGSLLYQERKAGFANFSPNGKWYSIYLRNDSGSSLDIINMETRKSIQLLTFKQGNYILDYEWIDGDSLYYRYYDGKSDKSYRKIINMDTSVEPFDYDIALIEAKGYLLSPLPQENDRVIFAKSTYDGYKIYKLSVSDLSNNNFRDSDQFSYHLKDAVFYYYDAHNKSYAAITFNKDSKEVKSWYFDPNRSKWEYLFQWPDDDFTFIPISRIHSTTMLVLSNKDSDRILVREFDIPSQRFGRIVFEHARYDIKSASVDPETNQLAWVTYYDHGRLTKEYFLANSKRIGELLGNKFKEKQFAVVAKNPQSSHRIVYVFSSDDAGKFYLYDETRDTVELIASVFPDLDDKALAKNQLVSVNSADGIPIEAFLTRPVADDNKTLIVMPHGGPIGVRELDIFDRDVHYLTSRGYSVLRVNFRGSAGYGKKFLDSGVGEFGKQIEKDISLIVDNVYAQHGFQHACAMGSSYGAYSSVLLSILHPERYDCIIGMFGIYDLPLLFNESNIRIHKDYRQAVEKVVGKFDASLKNESPTFLAKQVNLPILLIAGTKDEVAVIEQTNRFKLLLEKLGKNVESLYYQGVGHGHKNWLGDRHQMAYADNFIRKHLNLSPPTGPTYKQIAIEENLIIADLFEFDDFVDNDAAKAFAFYLRAANDESPRAMHNVAAYYAQGRSVEKNHNLAKQWHERASAAGYANSSFWLASDALDKGKENGNEEPASAEAFKYFELADNQGYDARARLNMGKLLCKGEGVVKDLTRCMEFFDLTIFKESDDEKKKDLVNKDVNKLFRQYVSEILADSQLDPDETKQFIGVVEKEYKIKLVALELEVESYGTFTYDYRKKLYVNDDQDAEFEYEKDIKIGVSFELRVPDDKNQNRVGVLTRWSLRESVTGEIKHLRSEILWGTIDSTWSTIWKLEETPQPGSQWIVEVLTLDSKPLYTHTFTLATD